MRCNVYSRVQYIHKTSQWLCWGEIVIWDTDYWVARQGDINHRNAFEKVLETFASFKICPAGQDNNVARWNLSADSVWYLPQLLLRSATFYFPDRWWPVQISFAAKNKTRLFPRLQRRTDLDQSLTSILFPLNTLAALRVSSWGFISFIKLGVMCCVSSDVRAIDLC